MALVLLLTYGIFLLFIFLYSLVQLNLAINYVRYLKSSHLPKQPELQNDELPVVTVQLPVYNEMYVVERLIRSVAALDYPKEKLEIQVLDDSTDESFELASKVIRELKEQGLDIHHIRRPDRKGYKAGALAYGTELARGLYIAIFDADFIPHPEFLRKTLPYFREEKVGVVQTRWEHVNENYSLLTKLQAFGLDAHFTVEQIGRNKAGHFINFNGTAGVWRRSCIEDAGGWQSDTITEDLDLSYRAQLRNWKFYYLKDVGSPAELPAEMNSLKSQQFRWTKGAAECAVKNLPKVLSGRNELGLATKVNAAFHLLNSFIFICILCTALLSIPVLFVKHRFEEFETLFNLASIFLLSFFILAFFYWISRPRSERRSIRGFFGFFVYFPLFLSVSMGLSLHNSIAVIEGYLGRKSPFVRTPKFALAQQSGSWTDKKYRALKSSPLTVLEGLLTLYFLGGIAMAFYFQEFGLLPFHVMLSLGFGYVFFLSFKHLKTA